MRYDIETVYELELRIREYLSEKDFLENLILALGTFEAYDNFIYICRCIDIPIDDIID